MPAALVRNMGNLGPTDPFWDLTPEEKADTGFSAPAIQRSMQSRDVSGSVQWSHVQLRTGSSDKYYELMCVYRVPVYPAGTYNWIYTVKLVKRGGPGNRFQAHAPEHWAIQLIPPMGRDPALTCNRGIEWCRWDFLRPHAGQTYGAPVVPS